MSRRRLVAIAVSAVLLAGSGRAGDDDPAGPQIQIQVRFATVDRTELDEAFSDAARETLWRWSRENAEPGAGFFTLDPPSPELLADEGGSVMRFFDDDAPLPGGRTVPPRPASGEGSGVAFPDFRVPIPGFSDPPRREDEGVAYPGLRIRIPGYPAPPETDGWDPDAFLESWNPVTGFYDVADPAYVKARPLESDVENIGLLHLEPRAGQPAVIDLSADVSLPMTGIQPAPRIRYGLRFELVPSVGPDGSVGMRMELRSTEVDLDALPGTAPDPAGGLPDIPGVSDRVLETSLLLRNGETVLLGGLFDRADDRALPSRIPQLGEIPILGALFRDAGYAAGRRSLIVMIRPGVLLGDGEGGSGRVVPAGSGATEPGPGQPRIRPRIPEHRPHPDPHVPKQPSYPQPRVRY